MRQNNDVILFYGGHFGVQPPYRNVSQILKIGLRLINWISPTFWTNSIFSISNGCTSSRQVKDKDFCIVSCHRYFVLAKSIILLLSSLQKVGFTQLSCFIRRIVQVKGGLVAKTGTRYVTCGTIYGKLSSYYCKYYGIEVVVLSLVRYIELYYLELWISWFSLSFYVVY